MEAESSAHDADLHDARLHDADLHYRSSYGRAPSQPKRFLDVAGIALPASAKRSLTKLIQSEIVYGSEKEHKFFDPFFRQWILSQF